MLHRVLEPEVMDSANEALEYDAMDHRAVNSLFADDALALVHLPRRILDVGTGTGLIAILLAARAPHASVAAVDLSSQMLRVADENVKRAMLTERVSLVNADAKALSYAPGEFDLIVSNSLIHHIPEPLAVLTEIARISAPGTAIFVRDLCRPSSLNDLTAIVDRYAANESESGRQLFHASLHAALTVDEMRDLADRAGLRDATVTMSSDRHWTLSRHALDRH